MHMSMLSLCVYNNLYAPDGFMLLAEWPYVGIKSSQFFKMVAQKVATASFSKNLIFLKKAQKVIKYLG